jgi:hypothetical protein
MYPRQVSVFAKLNPLRPRQDELMRMDTTRYIRSSGRCFLFRKHTRLCFAMIHAEVVQRVTRRGVCIHRVLCGHSVCVCVCVCVTVGRRGGTHSNVLFLTPSRTSSNSARCSASIVHDRFEVPLAVPLRVQMHAIGSPCSVAPCRRWVSGLIHGVQVAVAVGGQVGQPTPQRPLQRPTCDQLLDRSTTARSERSKIGFEFT